MNKIKYTVVICILTALIILPSYIANSTPRWVNGEASTGQTVTFSTALAAQGDVSDTLVIAGYSLNANPTNEMIVTILITDVTTSASIALEGCLDETGVFFNLRADGVERVTTADTLVYRYVGVSSLRAVRLHFKDGVQAVVTGKIRFGN